MTRKIRRKYKDTMRNNIQNLTKFGVCIGLFIAAINVWGAVPSTHSAISQAIEARWAAQTGSRGVKDPVPHAARADDEYAIGPSDVLEVNVWKDPELSAKVPVRPDGKISLPLIGELQVSGLTAMNVQLIVANKLKEYIANPEVTVIVTEIKSRTYVVVGKIAHPGSFDLSKPTSVLDAIAIAGGFLDFAKVSKVYIIRKDDSGKTLRLPFEYKKVINQRNTAENIDLKNGDTIVVP